jgi:prepilin-type N-terminal cleavage/methylation domain-containing protein/prepilin-type processing-associated H-X9-DG protein
MNKPSHTSLSPRSNRGFTLIELLVVIAIIGVLAGILVPTISGARVAAHRTHAVSQLKQIGVALDMYAMEHQGTYPQPAVGTNWAVEIGRNTNYLGPGEKWIHQGLTAPGVNYPAPGGGYLDDEDVSLTYGATGGMCDLDEHGYLNAGKGRKRIKIEDPARTPLVFLSKARGTDGSSVHIVAAYVHAWIKADLAAKGPGETIVFNFDLGGVMPVLMADGHVKVVEFDGLKSFMENNTWEGRVPFY